MPTDNLKLIHAGPGPQGAKDLRSEITYELVPGQNEEGCITPYVLGRGRFAKVFKAWQCSAGNNVRPVAIKILHEYIDHKSEQLFMQEIRLMKKLTSASGVNVINILDILQLGPMAMCGNCGQVYQPRCPQCGEHFLERYDPPKEAFPALRCKNQPRCKYTISAEHILNGALALMQYPAKTCCAKERGDRAQRGTLINFVDRDAVVMELLEEKLPDFNSRRRRSYGDLCRLHGVLLPPPYTDSSPTLSADAKTVPPALRPATAPEVEFVQKVLLLEKMLLMMQLAESVAWLHGSQVIVHKDLTPDNIMITALPCDEDSEADWRGFASGSLSDALTSLANYQSFKAKLIDFGLADQKQLTRHWYDEPVASFAPDKFPYFSLEARHRKRPLYQRIELDPSRRSFLIPECVRPDQAGELALKVGDLLVDESDPAHAYALEIDNIEQDSVDPHVFRATVKGEIPPNAAGRQFYHLLPLGEAHDIYALGAVFYFILTGDHTAVSKLTNVANVLQDAPQPLCTDVLANRVPNYNVCRARLPEPYYQDELMILILRAMVRGQEGSFADSRTHRGALPAQRLLAETRRIYNLIKGDLLTGPTALELEAMRSQYSALSRSHVTLQEAHATQAESCNQLSNRCAELNTRIVDQTNRHKRELYVLTCVAVCFGLFGVFFTRALSEGKLPAGRWSSSSLSNRQTLSARQP